MFFYGNAFKIIVSKDFFDFNKDLKGVTLIVTINGDLTFPQHTIVIEVDHPEKNLTYKQIYGDYWQN